MNDKLTSSAIAFLLAIIDQAYDHKSWHGTNLRGAIRGLSAKTAAWRPNPKRHNIWEIVTHAAYWKYAVRRRLLGEARGSFPLKGSNWFVRPQELTEAAWKADVKLLEDMHQVLRTAVAGLAPGRLREIPAGSKLDNFTVLTGIAAHDLYHAGQIQLLKRLAERR
ncbi:MAG: DinB family protein [candidate division KSB1 bacterium]|nr:DinB family protein [candidate division KSB1 bacterium]MDZ7276569.1 DinB family protein [candidate division KSB1 bacterium]MDZ7285012.1 DinB family protein [candidate division KSB1 bacterium]MDZ7298044.1 DinB family protein [candidate division KSB1 bacterium]MDZ7307432.1 DinB family protein [candidate division KSB1 bacterium]